MRLGVLGGTFNPIHFGHLRAAEEVREALALERVLFIPSGNPPLKESGLPGPEHRLRMAELAIEGNPSFAVSDIECRRRGKSYTVQTAAQLGREHPGANIIFILGIDAFLDIPRWHEPGKLVGMMDFAIVSRPGLLFAGLSESPFVDASDVELEALDRGEKSMVAVSLAGGRRAYLLRISALDISSTVIRGLVSADRTIRYLLPEPVENYIISKGLYLHEA